MALIVALVASVNCGRDDAFRPAPPSQSTPAPASPPPTAAAAAAAAPTPTNIYAAAGTNMMSPAVANMPYRLYVPESASSDVDVVDPATMKVVEHYVTGLDPQHVVP